MENPGSILHRARQNRRRRAVNPPPQTRPEPARTYNSGHANYNALMRSHDRMNTRHISMRGST